MRTNDLSFIQWKHYISRHFLKDMFLLLEWPFIPALLLNPLYTYIISLLEQAGLRPKTEIQATFPGSPKIRITISRRSNSQHETWAAAFAIRHFIQVEAAAVPKWGAGSSRRKDPFLWHVIILSCSAVPLQAALLGSLHTSTLAALSFPA